MALAAAVLSGGLVLAQSPSSAPGGQSPAGSGPTSPQTPGSQTPTQGPGSTMGGSETTPVTVPRPITIEGCIQRVGGTPGGTPTYRLTHFDTIPTSGNGGNAARPTRDDGVEGSITVPSTYDLVAGSGIDLSGNMNRRVQIVGTLANSASAAAGTAPSSDSSGNAGSRPGSSNEYGNGSAAGAGSAPTTTTLSTTPSFRVTSIKSVAGTCQ